MKRLLLLSLLIFASCAYHDDDEIRVVPVTNNPNLLPGGGSSGFPM